MKQGPAKPAPIYMTPDCARRLRRELKELLYRLRPEMVKTAAWAASNGDRSENADYHYAKKTLRKYDGRIRFLTQRLESATIVDPVAQGAIANGRVLFGCTVTVENEEREGRVFSIVGVDEYDPACGYVSWVSPIGRALLGARKGDVVSFQTPGGESELEILKIEYKALY
ncbi:MAG: transcription elongation factor GreB [Desulfuromonadales bacterium]|nr:transcription elongation factor GreB [Desulfuromonadales bacterium]